MDSQQHQLIERIRQAQNILVTVSANPTVDQLAAAIGLTLALNKLDKHGTAVFSGQVPSTIEFLKPERTLEKNTDSLRDFIIALDKSKADKLRYKVEDQVVRIFITPYKTSLSERDLDFSQGDFNVDVVVALGVTDQQDLDSAITAHGRILHDATVVSISTQGQGSLGGINWVEPTASSLSEMMVALCDGLDRKLLDNQIATALLTGIVASTERFRNDKTTPKTMSASAELMAAGANQQLIATELEAPAPEPVYQAPPASQPTSGEPAPAAEHKPEPGTLEINHDEAESAPPAAAPEPEPAPEPQQPQVHVDEDGRLVTDDQLPEISRVRGVGLDGSPTETGTPEVKRERIVEPPSLAASNLTANVTPEALDPSTEELTLPPLDAPLLTHNETVLPPTPPQPVPAAPADQFIPQAPLPPLPPTPPAPAANPFAPDTTLSQIEQSVDSPHLHAADPAPTGTVDDARSAVEAAFASPDAPADPLQPIAALNAQPLGPDLHEAPVPVAPSQAVPNTGFSEPTPGNTPADDAMDMPLPSNPFGPGQLQPYAPPAPAPSAFPGAAPQQPGMPGGQTPPPPVPPPMLPPLQ